MKKLILAVLLSFSFIVFPFTEQASAVEISVGATTWFCWWEDHTEGNEMNLNPTFLYGPVLSARFNESWSLAGVFLYGIFTPKDKGSDDGGPGSDISRFDSDISLNYNINRYFKLFGGAKYMGFSWDENNGDGTHWSAGPGLGLGSTLPLADSLYLLFNLSGTYSWGKEISSRDGSEITSNIKETSLSTSLSFAYYFASASTSVNLGFRYHYLFIDTEEKDNGSKDGEISFFGPTFSVVYSF